MAFGKPKKVGMKRATKKNVAVVEPVADDECPPSPPPVPMDPSGLTAGQAAGLAAGLAALPSPGKLLLDTLKDNVKDALGMFREAQRVLRQVERRTIANAEAVPKICQGIRYAQARVRRPLKLHTAQARLWEIKLSLAKDRAELFMHQSLAHEFRAELKEAHNRVLHEKLRQMAKRVSVRVQRRFGHRVSRANPMARFKLSPSK